MQHVQPVHFLLFMTSLLALLHVLLGMPRLWLIALGTRAGDYITAYVLPKEGAAR